MVQGASCETGTAAPSSCPSRSSSWTAKELGAFGEQLSASYLESIGFEILERGYRCAEGEADIIAYDPVAEQVVLVEVKTRRGDPAREDLYPEEAVDARKRRRYRRIASCYAFDHFPVPSIRFDVIGVCVHDGRVADVSHLYGAFDWACDR